MALKWTRTALRSLDAIAGFIAKDNPTCAGRVPGTPELVLHENYIAIYRVRGNDVEILRPHHVARNL
jgi:toxin ParE1/3/4